MSSFDFIPRNEVTANDVVMGARGNTLLLELVGEYFQSWLDAKGAHKNYIIETIIQGVHDQQGRFLQQRNNGYGIVLDKSVIFSRVRKHLSNRKDKMARGQAIVAQPGPKNFPRKKPASKKMPAVAANQVKIVKNSKAAAVRAKKVPKTNNNMEPPITPSQAGVTIKIEDTDNDDDDKSTALPGLKAIVQSLESDVAKLKAKIQAMEDSATGKDTKRKRQRRC